MLLIFKLFLTFLRVLLKSKSDLIIELMAKNQQLALYANTIKRVKLRNADRSFWVALSRIWPDWRKSLLIVNPQTIIHWHTPSSLPQADTMAVQVDKGLGATGGGCLVNDNYTYPAVNVTVVDHSKSYIRISGP